MFLRHVEDMLVFLNPNGDTPVRTKESIKTTTEGFEVKFPAELDAIKPKWIIQVSNNYVAEVWERKVEKVYYKNGAHGHEAWFRDETVYTIQVKHKTTGRFYTGSNRMPDGYGISGWTNRDLPTLFDVKTVVDAIAKALEPKKTVSKREEDYDD